MFLISPTTIDPRYQKKIEILGFKPRRKKIKVPPLMDFLIKSWEEIEPGTELEVNWHMELICEYLELVAERKISKLLINVAPRHLKSKLASVAFPAWQWLNEPSEKFLCMSYAGQLALDHNYDRRRLIQCDWYQELAGGLPLSFAKNRLSEFGNAFQGQMIARGLDGAVTGVGGTILIFDDPNDPEKVESQAIRESNLKKYRAYSSTRKNDPDAPIVVVQQRTAVDDISGWILKNRTDFKVICLPTVAEKDETIVFPKSGKVVHRRAGELLHASRFTQKDVDDAKTDLGTYLFSARHQQRPIALEGGIISASWIQRYTTPPAQPEQIIISVDSAAKAQQINDPWCFTVWAIWQGKFYLVDCLIRRMDYPTGKRMLLSYIQKHGARTVLIEDKSTGQSLIPELKTDLSIRGTAIIPIVPVSDKITRLSVETPAFEGGLVWLPVTAPWLPEYESALLSFPEGIADPADSTSQFLAWARQHLRRRSPPIAAGKLSRL